MDILCGLFVFTFVLAVFWWVFFSVHCPEKVVIHNREEKLPFLFLGR